MAIEQLEARENTQSQSGRQDGRQSNAGGQNSGRPNGAQNGSKKGNGLAIQAGGNLGRALGYCGIGLGLVQLFAPKRVAKLAGTRNHSAFIRARGLSEIITGVGVLASKKRGPWLWVRVAGDMLDLAAAGAALGNDENDRGKAALSLAAVAGITAFDVMCAQQACASEASQEDQDTEQAEASIIIDRSPEECYGLWRNLERAPEYMAYMRSVRVTGDKQSHWVASGPGDMRIEWDAEITEDDPGRKISWRSLPGGHVSASGTVTFEAVPAGRGTMVKSTVELSGLGAALLPVAKLIGKHPGQMAYKNLRRFKQLIEVGEVITTEGQSAGRSRGTTWLDDVAY